MFGEDYINGKILNNNNVICKEVSGFNLDNEGFQGIKNGWKDDPQRNINIPYRENYMDR